LYTFQQSHVHFIARVVVGFVWIYHGAVPKLLFQHQDELVIVRPAGVSVESAPTIVNWIGVAEFLIGLCVLCGIPSVRWPFIFTILFGIGVTAGAAIQLPHFLVAAFNPVSLNVQLIALSVIGLISVRDSHSAPLSQESGRKTVP